MTEERRIAYKAVRKAKAELATIIEKEQSICSHDYYPARDIETQEYAPPIWVLNCKKCGYSKQGV
jgi:hypothetical protein